MPRAASILAPALVVSTIAVCSCNQVVAPHSTETNGLSAERTGSTARNTLPPGGGWYPMAAGNQWRYRGTSFTEVTSPNGTRDTLANTVFELTIDQLGGQADPGEIGEQWTESFPNGGSSVTLRPVRQTRDGLWRIIASDPLVENQLLAYPLHPGQTWLQGGFGLETRMTVEGHESLATPAGNLPAWRIRVDRALHGPNDSHHVWYGRDGYLQLVSHTESVLADGSIVRSDHTHQVQSIKLAGPGRFSVANDRGRSALPLGPR